MTVHTLRASMVPIVGVHTLDPAIAEFLFHRASGEVEPCLVEKGGVPVRTGCNDHHRGRVGKAPKTRLALPQRGFDAFALRAETRRATTLRPTRRPDRSRPRSSIEGAFLPRSADRTPRYHRARNMSILRSRPPACHPETCCRFRAGSGQLPRPLRRWKPRQHETSVQESSGGEAAPRRSQDAVLEAHPAPPAPRKRPRRLSPRRLLSERHGTPGSPQSALREIGRAIAERAAAT